MTTHCRFCKADLVHTFVDLGSSPLCQTHIDASTWNEVEVFYPLHVWVCDRCFLCQLEEYVRPAEIFTEYAYFSSYSETWVEHARIYAERMIDRLHLDAKSLVVELASNDGYLLQHFVARGIPVYGVEPAKNVARAAAEKGIRTVCRFFGVDTAKELRESHGPCDLLLGNNVLAHVPDINDFVGGMKILLGPEGVITMEFPHLMTLVNGSHFDTIYHEHFSYLSFTTVGKIFAHAGFALFDVDELPTHGGSLRIYAAHSEDSTKTVSENVARLLDKEDEWGVNHVERYQSFGEKVKAAKRKILACLIRAKNEGKTIVGYGAPGKGNTLLNYCGIRHDFLDYTVDRNPYKQGKYTPGTRIPICAPEKIAVTRPDYIFVLPWNLKDEILEQMAFVRDWGAKFIVPIPEVEVL